MDLELDQVTNTDLMQAHDPNAIDHHLSPDCSSILTVD